MNPEQKMPVEITPEQYEMADDWIELCNLKDVADVDLEVMGETGSVRFGLARCADHMMDMTPDEISEWVRVKLKQQAESASQ